MKHAAVLGRNPALSVAELTAIGGSGCVDSVAHGVGLLNEDISSAADRLGGTTKLVRLTGMADSAEQAVSQAAGQAPSGRKLSFGLSIYGDAAAGQLSIVLKKYLRKRGISARFVPTKDALSTAQVKHNRLLNNGVEWCLVEAGGKWHVGETTWIQDFECFAHRDYEKPVNDTKRGMLPPKLARIMVNLGIGDAVNSVVYDPFCGSGVVLMEASLLGCQVVGSDVSKKAVTDTLQNLDWTKPSGQGSWDIRAADATAPLPFTDVNTIVTEGYLGTAATQSMDDSAMLEEAKNIEPMLETFLKQAHRSLKPQGTLVLTLPMWKLRGGTRRLSVIDRAEGLGYTRLRPLPENLQLSGLTDRETIEVSRPKQRVLHELVILRRN